ncbi:hypothetical protein [Pyxidicoccus xibeiensis]|uniref:hypothetical protein n=1 Tax=Pyxidicoccus xibeiensis TaxID=2906759 RepID=UPI0020A794D0|nr:hypothetical protein [Pyxidicoccus xibeiensis]MCP3135938.1 hypothetical protein [Pyxidicoccus xibeiensis]
MSLLTLPTKLDSWLCSSRMAVPLLMPVTYWGLGRPRRRARVLAFSPVLLGLCSLGLLGWRAARAQGAPLKKQAPRRPTGPFHFTWQMSEDFTASAASGH